MWKCGNAPTFAEVLQKNKKLYQNRIPEFTPTICIQKKGNDCGKNLTIENIKQTINLKKIKAVPKFIKEIKQGKIIIGEATQSDVEKIKNEINEKMSEDFTAEIQELKYPKIKVVNFEKNYTPEELANELMEKNFDKI